MNKELVGIFIEESAICFYSEKDLSGAWTEAYEKDM
jgi:hypothetical protein